jgi:hypothetical protein
VIFLTPEHAAEADRCIAALRRLYQDLAEVLHDHEARQELWEQIKDETGRLEGLIEPHRD